MPIYKASNGNWKIHNVPGPGHSSRKAAEAQFRAIEASKHKAKTRNR